MYWSMSRVSRDDGLDWEGAGGVVMTRFVCMNGEELVRCQRARRRGAKLVPGGICSRTLTAA